MSQSSNHFKLVTWTWQWVHFTKMAPTVTRSQPNRASLGCGGIGASYPGCTSHKSPSTARCFQHLVESMPRVVFLMILKVSVHVNVCVVTSFPLLVMSWLCQYADLEICGSLCTHYLISLCIIHSWGYHCCLRPWVYVFKPVV